MIVYRLAKKKFCHDWAGKGAELAGGSWNSFPYSSKTQLLGDEFVSQSKSLVLKVPSAVVQGDFNYLFNRAHSDFGVIKIGKTELFSFDERLFK